MHSRGTSVPLALLLLMATSCSSTLNEYTCETDQACQNGTTQGFCEESSFCSFATLDCESGRSYGSSAGVLSGKCVMVTVDAGLIDAAQVIDAGLIDAQGTDAAQCASSPTEMTWPNAAGTESWQVPQSCTKVEAKAWGAAGGAQSTFNGGGGGFVSGEIEVAPCELLTVVVGGGGGKVGGNDSENNKGAAGGENGGGDGGDGSLAGLAVLVVVGAPRYCVEWLHC